MIGAERRAEYDALEQSRTVTVEALLKALSGLTPADDEEAAWLHARRGLLLSRQRIARGTIEGARAAAIEFEKSGLLPVFRTFKFDDIAEAMARCQRFRRAQADAIARGQPLVLLNALPKSASLFMTYYVASVLQVPVCRITWATSGLNSVVMPASAALLARGGATVHNSIAPDPDNMRTLVEAGVDRMVLQLRDPRQAAVSMAHQKLQKVGQLYEVVDADTVRLTPWGKSKYPPSIASRDVVGRRDLIVHTARLLFDSYVAFVNGWWAIYRSRQWPVRIHIAAYRTLIGNPLHYCRGVLDFCGAVYDDAGAAQALIELSKGKIPHARKGELEEFREIFPADQQRELFHRIDPDAAATLGWEP
jgi:hypothetical protein